jgi:hypothetical protein
MFKRGYRLVTAASDTGLLAAAALQSVFSARQS